LIAPEFKDSPIGLTAEQHRIAGRYRVRTRIGSGRLGDIFAAVDDQYESFGVEQQVAIQLVPETVVRNHTLFNKLSTGYKQLADAAHPNIVDYRHFGRDGVLGYLVMELLDGASLHRLLDEVDTLPLEEALPVIRGVGEALQWLHANDLAHGSLAPGNIFITSDLRVRLLDIVPLGAATGGSAQTSAPTPFGRCSIDDDVFALACLTYEMLAGRHPFNFNSRGRAREDALVPARIPSVTDSEWEAIRRALSFEPGQQTGTVAEFLCDLGVKGTERLSATDEQRSDRYVADVPAAAVPPQGAGSATPVAALPPTLPQEPTVPPAPVVIGRAEPIPTRDNTHPVRTAFLGAVLAGLAGWLFLGDAREQATDAIGYVDETLDLGLTDWFAPDVSTVVATTFSPVEYPQAADIPVVDGSAPDDAVEAVTEESADDSVGDSQAPQTLASDPVETAEFAAGGDVDADDPPANDAASGPPTIRVAAPIMSVSEREGAARIVVASATGLSSLFWWTSDHTAVSDADFIAVPYQLADIGPGGDAFLVPLVNDAIPESSESFFVNFGIRDAAEGRLDRIATVRVDVVDDDHHSRSE
jgi:hypothetical protein